MDELDVPLEDPELLAEVELTTNLIIAASASEAPMTQAEIDRVLGVDPGAGRIPAQQARGLDEAPPKGD